MVLKEHVLHRVIRVICSIFLLTLIAPISPSQSFASTTVTKTVTVKAANDSLYSGAQISVIYFSDGDISESFAPIVTTNSTGQATISYPADASYAQMFITPPSTDTTNAVEVIDLLTSTDSAIANVKLKTASIRVKPTTPSGGDAGTNTCISYPKSPISRWVTTQYRTTRTGAFGVNIPSTLNSSRDYLIELSPCNKSDYRYLGKSFGLRRASNGTVSLYTDNLYKTLLTPTSGVYVLAFDQGNVTGELRDTNGSPLSVADGTYIVIRGTPLLPDGTPDYSTQSAWADNVCSDG